MGIPPATWRQRRRESEYASTEEAEGRGVGRQARAAIYEMRSSRGGLGDYGYPTSISLPRGSFLLPSGVTDETTRGVATRCYPCIQQTFRCQGKTAFENPRRLTAALGKSVLAGAFDLGIRAGGVWSRGDQKSHLPHGRASAGSRARISLYTSRARVSASSASARMGSSAPPG